MNKNEETKRDTATWTDLYNKVMGNAGSHRATGISKAKHRGGASEATRLSENVTQDDAHTGAVNTLLAEVPAYCRMPRPTAQLAARMVYGAIRHQSRCESTPSLSVTGERAGEHHKHVELEGDMIAPHNPFADIDSAEEVAACLASLPEIHRNTLTALVNQGTTVSKRRLKRDRKRGAVASDACPENVSRDAWERRVSRARNAFRAVWLARQNTSLRGFGGASD